ncbi:ABC transporter permease [Ruegeria lacuscaerulensis]|uniref:ABC transporter permease n=1 Tax=Ruegeria lacuscaerulensis TaxID=55218 RepID=UPI001479943E|nr:ABC transporter permease subunit [Ruegeria lacuscaerulensis]
MIALLRRLLWKELYDLARQPWVLLGAFLIPLYVMQVSTTFVQSDAPVSVLVSYAPGDQEIANKEIEALSRIDGISPVAVAGTRDINLLMAQRNVRLGILLSWDSRRTFVERSASRYERRLNVELATRIHQALGGSDRWLTSALAGYIESGGLQIDLRHLSVMPSSDSQTFIPRILALIIVLLATVLSARSTLRELESRTLPLLVTLPHSNWSLVLGAKLIFVVLLTTAVTSFLLLTLQPVFGFFLRPGVAEIYGAEMLAALAATCVGTSLALLGRSTVQAYLAVSIYLIANLILTGFITNLADPPTTSEAVLHTLFPLTYLRSILEGWLFFGEPVSWHAGDFITLTIHAIVSLIVLFGIAYYRQRQF